MPLGNASQYFRHQFRPLGINVYQHIIHDERQRDNPLGKVGHQPEADTKVELLNCPPAQSLLRTNPAMPVDDDDLMPLLA